MLKKFILKDVYPLVTEKFFYLNLTKKVIYPNNNRYYSKNLLKLQILLYFIPKVALYKPPNKAYHHLLYIYHIFL